MICKYICSTCGKKFDDAEDCKKHEFLCGITEKQLAFHCFDEDMNPLKYEYGMDCFSDCHYVIFDNKKAFDFFNAQQDYYGYCRIEDYLYANGHVYYYSDYTSYDDGWVDLTKLRKRIDSILNEITAQI